MHTSYGYIYRLKLATWEGGELRRPHRSRAGDASGRGRRLPLVALAPPRRGAIGPSSTPSFWMYITRTTLRRFIDGHVLLGI